MDFELALINLRFEIYVDMRTNLLSGVGAEGVNVSMFIQLSGSVFVVKCDEEIDCTAPQHKANRL